MLNTYLKRLILVLLKEYQDPDKRRGGKKEGAEEVAHKVAWAAVKKEYAKEGDKWVRKGE